MWLATKLYVISDEVTTQIDGSSTQLSTKLFIIELAAKVWRQSVYSRGRGLSRTQKKRLGFGVGRAKMKS
jgi:hypothetical protein